MKSDSEFPKDLPADPSVTELNFSEMMPVMNVNLSGDYALLTLKKYAEYLEDEIEDLQEISKVDIRGASDFEVEIEVNYLRAEAMLVSFNDIAGALSAENLTIAGIGSALLGFNKISIEAHGFPKYNENLNKLIDQQRIEKKSLEDVDPFKRDTQNDYKTTVVLQILRNTSLLPSLSVIP